MTIRIQRLGGFAGIVENLVSLDSGQLPEAVRKRLQLQLARLSELASRTGASEGADQYYYQVEIGEAGVPPRTLIVVDQGDPNDPAIQAVLRLVELLAGRSR